MINGQLGWRFGICTGRVWLEWGAWRLIVRIYLLLVTLHITRPQLVHLHSLTSAPREDPIDSILSFGAELVLETFGISSLTFHCSTMRETVKMSFRWRCDSRAIPLGQESARPGMEC